MSTNFLAGLEVAASGLRAQRSRLNVISANLANAQTTRAEGGQGAYRRQQVVFASEPVRVGGFDEAMDQAVHGVRVQAIEPDNAKPMQRVYDPGHPDADEEGFVEMPNVDVTEEMVDMILASRSYEASATAFETLKSMAQRALQIG